MRESWMIIHRWSGLVSVVFLTIAALTGCLLVFRAPLDRALNPDLFLLPASVAASATGPDRAIAAVEAYSRANPAVQAVEFPLNLPAGRTLPVQIVARPGAPAPVHDEIFLDPRDGSVVGGRATGSGWDGRHLVAKIAELHFTLLAGDWGRWLLGVVAVVWLVSSCVGAWLTWPARAPRWKQWKRTWQVRRSSALPRFLLDLHRASGLWLLPFLLVLAFTSAALNFFGELWEPFATTVAPLERSLFDQDAPYPKGATPTLSFAQGLAAAEAQAARDGLEWQPATMLYLPEWNFHGVKFSPGGELSYRDLGPVDYYFDAATNLYRHEVNPYDDSAGLVLIRVLYPLHSGEIFGTITLVLVFVLGLTTVGHGATGIYIWWKKRKSRIARTRATRQSGEQIA